MRTFTLFLAVCLSLVHVACKDEEEPLQVFPAIDGETLQVYQLAKVFVKDLPVNDQSFEGTFGNLPVSLGRIPGDTLIFIVPKVGVETAQLSVTVGNQIRNWDFLLHDWLIDRDWKLFLEGFLKSARDLQIKIQDVDKLKDLASPFGLWIEFFTQKQLPLSNVEKESLSKAFQVGQYDYYFANGHDSFEMPCINSPESIIGSMVYYLGFESGYDYSNLKIYSKLPKNAFHEAVVSGFALSFWYQKILLEYYALQTLECPVLREIKLTYAATGENINPGEPFQIESKVPVSFGTVGTFKRLTNADLQGQGGLFSSSDGFRGKTFFSTYFSDLLRLYSEDYDWQLPSLNPNSLVFPPDDAPVTQGPVQRVVWDIPTFSDPIRLTNFKSVDGSITLILDSKWEEPVPFSLKLSLRANNSFLTDFELSSVLDPGCPLEVDVLLIGRTHFIDIESGQPPYQIDWSNGPKGILSQTFSPGNYEVNVRDAAGCERYVAFTVPEFGTVEDIDGNVYETVKVGDDWWMTENLRTTRLNTGTSIRLAEANADWISATGPAYSWQNNNSNADKTFGKLYNYYAACCDICPTGWRLPSPAEISTLSRTFGFPYGKYIRSVDSWPESNIKANNQSGLKFLPSGGRTGISGNFFEGLELGTFWTGYKDQAGLPFLGLVGESGVSLTFSVNNKDGLSVRCVKGDDLP